MKLSLVAAMTLLASPVMFGQAKTAKSRAPAPVDRDQLGMTCTQILAMSSTDWVAEFNEKASGAESSQDKTVRAIGVYGKCYEARTDRLAALAGKKGTGPLMGARGNFRDFEQTLQNFSAKALAMNDPPADAVKTAYAALYEKQFPYEFYKSADNTAPQPSGAKRPGSAKPQPAAAGAPAAASKGAAPAAQAQAHAMTAPDPGPTQAAPPTAPDDADPMTLAKNHFGELLDGLAEDQMHELHSAFGDVMSRGEMSEATRLAVYRYAIYLLEPATAEPFSPPPF